MLKLYVSMFGPLDLLKVRPLLLSIILNKRKKPFKLRSKTCKCRDLIWDLTRTKGKGEEMRMAASVLRPSYCSCSQKPRARGAEVGKQGFGNSLIHWEQEESKMPECTAQPFLCSCTEGAWSDHTFTAALFLKITLLILLDVCGGEE